MIPTESMNHYTKNHELNIEILEWINRRILSLLNIYIELGEDIEWEYEHLYICFPRDLVEDDSAKCLRILHELCDILKSDYIRKDIKLIYKFVLVKLIEYFQALYEDAKESGEENLCNIYFPPVEESLVKKVYKEYGYHYNGRVNYEAIDEEEQEVHPQTFIELGLEDIDGLFWDDVFDDIEIDIDMIDERVNHYLDKIENGEYIDIDFEYYFDLMSRDTKERYYKIKPLLEKIQDKMTEVIAGQVVQECCQYELRKIINKDRLVQDICGACALLQANSFIGKVENGRNIYIRDILRSKGYDIIDQTLRGKSATGKQSGELDFEIMDTNEKPYAIYEGLNLTTFAETGKKYWRDHLIKTLDNYNPMGIPLAFLVSYAKVGKAKFSEYWLKYYRNIKDTSLENYSIQTCRECNQDETYVRCAEAIYECGDIYTTVYHILVRTDN